MSFCMLALFFMMFVNQGDGPVPPPLPPDALNASVPLCSYDEPAVTPTISPLRVELRPKNGTMSFEVSMAHVDVDAYAQNARGDVKRLFTTKTAAFDVTVVHIDLPDWEPGLSESVFMVLKPVGGSCAIFTPTKVFTYRF